MVCVLGSPRAKGNSTTLAKHFCDTAAKSGAEITTFSLNKLTYKGCQACMTCKTKLDKCVLKDDLTQVLDAVREADIVVMATPTYYGEVSSQMKSFIDRTFSYLVSDYMTNPNPSRLAPGKKLVFIQAQAQPEQNLYADVFPRYDSFFKWYGFQDNHLIRACGVRDAGEVSAREDVMKQTEQLAQKLTA
ncbi:MAG: NADPH-dependent FMN reductase [Desulfobacteraceae bacterium IS3]|nr:MAG: NADPH-dependent FMN reductase [Desulfobacteraceae bacterium IS3]